MARNQIEIFAGPIDLKALLEAIETTSKLKYTLAGLFDSPELESLPTLLNRQDLGYVKHHSSISQPRYLVADDKLSIKVEKVPQRRGGIKYAVDQGANPDTIVFRGGGIFEEGCLIAGQIGTASATKVSLSLYKVFAKEIGRQFVKVKSYSVGKQAAECLDKGWRLTANTKSPTLYDLTR